MLYELLLVVHLLSFVGWAGLTTGAYMVVREVARGDLPHSYRRLAYVQAGFAGLLFLSGLSMAVVVYGFPKSPLWIHYALGVALIAGIIEAIHVRAARRYDADRYHKFLRALIPMWVAIVAVMLWLMVWKPF
ncbi:hypothetical protein Pogu_1683 [Pyrobaculum oguniense TE7]|uniref:Protoporphyrinogen IX oxidase n=1 Tax=Pyrobaculum oguniense (strain DSM 13380 / JCM 10595 / TE7) TaxID=698757 RepID=H6QAT2_PYROT|nr:hypothetical protein Pogu_1683 [Pyrobaculum oguniense TE7]